MSRTGFGESQAASSPEGLTDLLSRGIDLLLDMPALEFKAQNLTADGETHRLGIDSAVNSLHDEMSLKLPEPFWKTKLALYYAAAGVVALILCGFMIWRFKSPRPASIPAPYSAVAATPVPTPPPVPPPFRAATVAEPGSRVMRPLSTPPVIRYSEPLPQTQAATTAKTSRVPTALAPQPTDGTSQLSLTALTGPYAGQTFPINEQEFWIGSAQNNHLCLTADGGVSGNHFCIRTEQSFRRLYDNGSLNNTWVNGRSVGQQIAVIQPGDRIRVGASEFLVEANGDA